MRRGIFVIGTGTDVGKTYISALLAKKLKESGIDIGYFKAAVSGNEYDQGELIPGDALYVKTVAGLSQELTEMVPYVYEHAYSPHLAALVEGHPVRIEIIRAAFEQCMKKHSFVLVEGSGGILCPLRCDDEEIWLEDVVRETGFDSLLVADAGLGTINSLVLTYEYMKAKNLPIAGIIFNHYEAGNVMHEDNIKMIRHRTNLPIFACVESEGQDLKMDVAAFLE